jgi:hypothetical protein
MEHAGQGQRDIVWTVALSNFHNLNPTCKNECKPSPVCFASTLHIPKVLISRAKVFAETTNESDDHS